MKAIVTVTGKDHKGIVASVSTKLAEVEVNILDISQTLMESFFTMIVLVDLSTSPYSIIEIQDKLGDVEKKEQLVIRIQSEDIFNAMHTL
ncbi:hypothetical protein BW727_101796 [Jeotgalibaca dankookensis]|uniref:UPF0237 protein BW727_101796 n=1 Tax=Jeotgalibaca dankookensis TaxID=708126 RepID=A0A1S6IRP3_9LACT|nr:ACT domain-containing protein [Jeotgalibaca dankookensis]AQS54150.1 hypothetical protein BW727_101796 [Jeotgalibaca dankookensis]